MVWVNFLPWRARRLQTMLQCWSLAWLVLLVAFLTALLPITGLQALNAQRAKMLHRQKDAGLQLSNLRRKMDTLARQYRHLEQQQASRRQQQSYIGAWADFASELSMKMPETLWLSELNKTSQQMNLTGFCMTMADVRDLRLQLLQMPLFSDVRTGKLVRDPRGLIQFSLTAVLKHPTAPIPAQDMESEEKKNAS